MEISIRAQYSSEYDWGEALRRVVPVGSIELAFYDRELFLGKTELDDVVLPIKDLGLQVPTTHMASCGLSDIKLFMWILMKTIQIARAVGCRSIIVHPSNESVKDFGERYDQIVLPALESYDCDIHWETFAGKRRSLPAWNKLVAFCGEHGRSYICYDICHMRPSTEKALEDIDTYYDFIRGFHFSNWKPGGSGGQHLPLEEGVVDYDKIIRHLVKTDFQGNITLEYLPQFHNRLVADALDILDKVYS